MSRAARKSLVAAAGISFFLVLAGTQCYDDEEYSIENRTGEAIDVEILMHWGWHADKRDHYSGLKVGDFDYGRGCRVCGIPSRSVSDFLEETEPGKPATLVARSADSRQLLFKREFSYEEMEDLEWRFEIVDMRRPEQVRVPVFRSEAELTCTECSSRRVRIDYDSSFYETVPEPFHMFDYSKSLQREFERIRMYGADVAHNDGRCRQEAGFWLLELIGGGGPLLRLESGPSLTDESGAELFYLYTDDGRSIDEILIRNGLARAADNDGQHSVFLKQVEAEAVTEGVGCQWK